jgi:hypothetical protein
MLYESEADEADSGSCQMGDFGIFGAESLGSITTQLVGASAMASLTTKFLSVRRWCYWWPELHYWQRQCNSKYYVPQFLVEWNVKELPTVHEERRPESGDICVRSPILSHGYVLTYRNNFCYITNIISNLYKYNWIKRSFRVLCIPEVSNWQNET